MKFAVAFAAMGLLCAGSLAGCHRTATPSQVPKAEDPETAAKVAKLETQMADLVSRLEKIESIIEAAVAEASGAEPEVEAVYSVPIDGLPYIGPEHAKVTLVKAYEFACGYCAQVADTMTKLAADYAGELKVVYAPFIVHADVAIVPALAACAANEQGKFVEMAALIWQKGFAERDLSSEKMEALAKEAGLDLERYRADAASPSCKASLHRMAGTLSRVGTTGTPTFYINGRYMVGARPIEHYKEIIDEELAKANRAIAAGMNVADYYRKVVVEGGKKSLR